MFSDLLQLHPGARALRRSGGAVPLHDPGHVRPGVLRQDIPLQVGELNGNCTLHSKYIKERSHIKFMLPWLFVAMLWVPLNKCSCFYQVHELKRKVRVMLGSAVSNLVLTLQEPGDGRGPQGDCQVPGHPSLGAEGRGARGQRGELGEAEFLLRLRAGRVSVGDGGIQECQKAS